MSSIAQSADSVTPRHEQIMNLGLVMARDSVDRWFDLDREQRRELLRCWTAFMGDLHALGISAPKAVSL